MTARNITVHAVWDSAVSDLTLQEGAARFSNYFAESSGYYAVVETFPHRCRVRFILSHEDPTDAAFEGIELFREAVQKFDLPTPLRLDTEVEARFRNNPEPAEEGQQSDSVPPIVGVSEAADLLGITKQRLAQLMR